MKNFIKNNKLPFQTLGIAARAYKLPFQTLGIAARAYKLPFQTLGMSARAYELPFQTLGMSARAYKLPFQALGMTARAFKLSFIKFMRPKLMINMKNRINFFICLLIIFSQPCLAQTGNTSTVQLKAHDIETNNSKLGKVTENRTIGFFVTGMKSEKDAGTIENLLYKQMEINYPRANYNSSYCAFVTLKESDIGEAFVKKLLESAGFGINNYRERITKNVLNKKVDKPTAKILTTQ